MKSVEKGKNAGYRNFNFKPGIDPKTDAELLRPLRKRLPNAFLWADADQAYDVTTAIAMSRKLADARIDVFEQPLKTGRPARLARFAAAFALPIAIDEPICDYAFLHTLLRRNAIDIFVLKVARSGSVDPSRRMLELARTAGLRIRGSGLTVPRVNLTACAQLLAAYGVTEPAALQIPDGFGILCPCKPSASSDFVLFSMPFAKSGCW